MAGDWIKMRSDLFTHPKVVRISSALKADTLRTVGGLMSVWCLFDAHSVDGTLEGYAPETLDDHLRWPGFAAAMMSIRWLEITDLDGVQSLALPDFDTHNGQSAKRRAHDADRKQAVRKVSASDADKKRTREEKRREEIEATHSAGAGAQAGAGELLVTDGDGNPAKLTDFAPVMGAGVIGAKRLRNIGGIEGQGIKVNGIDPTLLALLNEKFGTEEMALIAAELVLKKAHLWNDSDLHPELQELLAGGAKQQQMLLTDAQYAAIRGGIAKVSITYIAETLRGRRQDAIDKQGGKQPARNNRKPSATDNFEGKTYAGTPIEQLDPALRAGIERALAE